MVEFRFQHLEQLAQKVSNAKRGGEWTVEKVGTRHWFAIWNLFVDYMYLFNDLKNNVLSVSSDR
jgi:hypothetical protein